MRRTTIKDVAALAGVSPATVSRTLDDRPEISAETKERVRAACAQLGYVPNAAAKGLTGQATHTLGVVVPDVSNPYFTGIATAIEETAAENGYRVLLSNSLQEEGRELRAIENFLARQIDGVLISPLSRESQAKHADLLEGTPCVYLGVNHGEKCSYVMADNEAGAAIAVRYLLQLGHRDLVFLGGRADSLTRVQRVRGFRRALREHGLSGRVLPAPPDTRELRQWAYEQALALFGERTLPHAVLAFSDLTALRILEAAEERGIRVPEALSLVVEYQKKRPAAPIKLSQADLERIQTVAAYLSDHYAAEIPMERLTQIACMGTTKLKSSFKKVYDCTITEYIQQRRMSQAEYLLTNTDLSIGQIAQTVGYSTSSRFAELFRKSTGLLPGEFRKVGSR